MVDEIEMSGVFSAAATDVLALDATDAFSADTTDVFYAAKADDGPREEAEGRLMRVDALGAFRRPGHRPAGGRRPT